MKKLLFTVSVLFNLLLITAADFKVERGEVLKQPEVPAKKKTNCGYTIVEFGKGIDCNGDTIKLARVNGVQVRIDS